MYIDRMEENIYTGFKRLLFIMLIFCLLFVSTGGAVSAAEYEMTTTHSYSCKAHKNCLSVAFKSHGETSNGKIYSKYFSGNNSHWPNAFKYDNVWSYKVGNTGYAKGTYTLYSSLVTQWASLSFKSTSKTITHTY